MGRNCKFVSNYMLACQIQYCAKIRDHPFVFKCQMAVKYLLFICWQTIIKTFTWWTTMMGKGIYQKINKYMSWTSILTSYISHARFSPLQMLASCSILQRGCGAYTTQPEKQLFGQTQTLDKKVLGGKRV